LPAGRQIRTFAHLILAGNTISSSPKSPKGTWTAVIKMKKVKVISYEKVNFRNIIIKRNMIRPLGDLRAKISDTHHFLLPCKIL